MTGRVGWLLAGLLLLGACRSLVQPDEAVLVPEALGPQVWLRLLDPDGDPLPGARATLSNQRDFPSGPRAVSWTADADAEGVVGPGAKPGVGEFSVDVSPMDPTGLVPWRFDFDARGLPDTIVVAYPEAVQREGRIEVLHPEAGVSFVSAELRLRWFEESSQGLIRSMEHSVRPSGEGAFSFRAPLEDYEVQVLSMVLQNGRLDFGRERLLSASPDSALDLSFAVHPVEVRLLGPGRVPLGSSAEGLLTEIEVVRRDLRPDRWVREYEIEGADFRVWGFAGVNHLSVVGARTSVVDDSLGYFRQEVSLTLPRSEPVELHLGDAVLHVRVQDSEGRPQSGLICELESVQRRLARADTHGMGLATFLVPPGQYQLSVFTKTGSAERRIVDAEGERTVTVTLPE